VSDIDTVVVDSLKALDPEWPIREGGHCSARLARQKGANNGHRRCACSTTSSARLRARNFAQRTLWNVGATMTAYSALMLAARITLLHFSASVAMNLSEIGGRARKRRRTQIGEPRFYVGFGKSSVYLLVQLVDDFGGCVLWCGNPKPITSLEARRNSLTVGTSGRICERSAVVTANARSLPSLNVLDG